MSTITLSILNFEPQFAQIFKEINEEWINEMFEMEEKDRQVLTYPEEKILNNGGHILFVEAGDLGIVGTCALIKTGENEYELSKMGVLKKARGLNAGGHLLNAMIKKAKEIDAKKLYLLTNRKCESAIHLYEKHGFKHDLEIMSEFGGEYERCNVAMRYRN